MELKKFASLFPLLFPVFALIGLALFGAKVIGKGHNLSEIPWTGLLFVSLLLGLIFTLQLLANIALLRWDPTVVRLANQGVGKWCNKPDTPVHVDYSEIKNVSLCTHPIVPQVRAIKIDCYNRKQFGLALPDSIDPKRVLKIFAEHGVAVGAEERSDPQIPAEGKK